MPSAEPERGESARAGGRSMRASSRSDARRSCGGSPATCGRGSSPRTWSCSRSRRWSRCWSCARCCWSASTTGSRRTCAGGAGVRAPRRRASTRGRGGRSAPTSTRSSVYLERNVPGEGEQLITVPRRGSAPRRERNTESFTFGDFVARWRTLDEIERGEIETPGGPAALPRHAGRGRERTLGTFVVAELHRGRARARSTRRS